VSVEENNPVVRVPLVVKPVGIAVELRAIPVTIGDVPVAVLVAQYAKYPPCHCPTPPLGAESAVSYPAS